MAKDFIIRSSSAEFLIFERQTHDKGIQVRFENGDLWLTQKAIGELFDTTRNNITMHINEIYNTYELDENLTSKKFLLVQNEGNREVKRNVQYYNLDMVISIGYRVNSDRAIQFRRWATNILKEFSKKGYIIDKKKNELKNDNIEIDKKWNAKMINVILQNRVYTGDLNQGKKKAENYHTHKLISTSKDEWIITQNHHEPIILKDKFDKVQEIIKKNKCARSNKEKDLFYRFLKCSDCRNSFTLRKVKNYEYYHCISYVRNGSCTSHSIRKDKLIDIVLRELNKKFKRKNIKILSRDILLKNVDSIIIFQN